MALIETNGAAAVVYIAAGCMFATAAIPSVSPDVGVWTGISLSLACTMGAFLGAFLSIMVAPEGSVATSKQVAKHFLVSLVTSVLFTPAVLEFSLPWLTSKGFAATPHLVVAASAAMALLAVELFHRMPVFYDIVWKWWMKRWTK